MAIMKENKEKELVSGDDIIQTKDVPPLQTHPAVSKMLKLVPPSSLEKRKAMSKMIDIGNPPSCRDHKRPKMNTSIPAKALVIELDPSTSLVAKTPLKAPTSEASSCPDPELTTIPPIEDPATTSYTLLKSENLAWNRFKMVVKEDDVMACYDMSVKEFKHSTNHDLFKVFFFIHNNLLIIAKYYFNVLFCSSCPSLWRCLDKPQTWAKRGSG